MAAKKTTRRAPSLEQRTRELAIELAKIALGSGQITSAQISYTIAAEETADRYLRLARALLTSEAA